MANHPGTGSAQDKEARQGRNGMPGVRTRIREGQILG